MFTLSKLADNSASTLQRSVRQQVAGYVPQSRELDISVLGQGHIRLPEFRCTHKIRGIWKISDCLISMKRCIQNTPASCPQVILSLLFGAVLLGEPVLPVLVAERSGLSAELQSLWQLL